MRKLSRDAWLTMIVLVVLGLLTIVAASQQSVEEELPSYSSYSPAPQGGRAVLLWLEELAFDVTNESPAVFDIPTDTDAVIMLQPYPFLLMSDEEWETINTWVDGGGILFIIGEGFGFSTVYEHYEFEPQPLKQRVESLAAYSPHLNSPPQTLAAHVEVNSFFVSERDDYLTLMAVEKGPVTVAFQQEEGWVVLSTLIYPFSNQGLKEPGNPELVLNTLALMDRWSTVWVDEWHHGHYGASNELSGPADWLRFTPTGRAMLYVVGVVLLGVVLSGRLFGKPVPIPKTSTRRPELEYVSSMANLKRRIGHRQDALDSYRQALKREYSRRYRIDPDLTDEEYIQILSQYIPAEESDALHDLLNRLGRKSVSEQSLVGLASEVAQWINPEE